MIARRASFALISLLFVACGATRGDDTSGAVDGGSNAAIDGGGANHDGGGAAVDGGGAAFDGGGSAHDGGSTTYTDVTALDVNGAPTASSPLSLTADSNKAIRVSGVVVTSPVMRIASCKSGAHTDWGIFVSAPGGGDYSGFLVHACDDFFDLKTEVQNQGLTPGSIVDVEGRWGFFPLLNSGTCPIANCSSCCSATGFNDTQVQVEAVHLTKTGTGTAPAAVTVNAADIATGGSRARALRGSLVKVSSVSITSPLVASSDGGSGTHGEFTVTGGLLVGSLFCTASPCSSFFGANVTTSGTQFTSITGAAYFSFGKAKLEPRSSSDLVAH